MQGADPVRQKKEEKEYDFKVRDTTLEAVPDTKKLSVMRTTSEMISLYEGSKRTYNLLAMFANHPMFMEM